MIKFRAFVIEFIFFVTKSTNLTISALIPQPENLGQFYGNLLGAVGVAGGLISETAVIRTITGNTLHGLIRQIDNFIPVGDSIDGSVLGPGGGPR